MAFKNFPYPKKALTGGWCGKHLAAEQRAQVDSIADDGHGNIHEPHMAGIELGKAGFAAAALCGLIALGAGVFFVGAEAMHQVTKVRAGFTRRCSGMMMIL